MNKPARITGGCVTVEPPPIPQVGKRERPRFFRLASDPDKPRPVGRPRVYDDIAEENWPEYRGEYLARRKQWIKKNRLQQIAILDMETDPFDNTKDRELVLPFLAVLYTDDAEPIIIWDDDTDRFVVKVINAIESLPGRYTIYAHNGGKFDYLYLIWHLRGRMNFKGRGLMQAKVGNHTLRDSYHIIPESLAKLQKDDFDYRWMARDVRYAHKDAIIEYCIDDCRYLLKYVKAFLQTHGFKISIGQAAMADIKKHYEIKRFGKGADTYLRQWFFGGRTECLAGQGTFRGPYRVYDVNSMYPHVMAAMKHPVGNSFHVRTNDPVPTKRTIFIRLECTNYGALCCHDDDGSMSFSKQTGEFFTTIWEYNVALKYNLIRNVKILECVDFNEVSDFSRFVIPHYANRIDTKRTMEGLEKAGKKDTREYFEAQCANINSKLLLNNAYGKQAQDPSNYGEFYFTDPFTRPKVDCKGCKARWPRNFETMLHDTPEGKTLPCRTWGKGPYFRCNEVWQWKRPATVQRYNNVAMAASITGAARALLLEAIQLATDPIYCDTDSLIALDLGGLEIDTKKLGAWKIEKHLDEVKIYGKKLYGYLVSGIPNGQPGREVVKSKGVPAACWKNGRYFPGITYDQLDRTAKEQGIEIVANHVTLNRYGHQTYARRIVKATAVIKPRTNAATRGFTNERAPRVSG